MISTKLELCAVISALCFVAVVSAGSKGYGQECSIASQVIGLVKKDAEECNSDKKFVCITGKCDCNIGYVYEKGIFGVELFGGGCRRRATFPCANEDVSCVSNSHCDSICRCKEGYYPNIIGECSGAGGLTVLAPLITLGLALSYFIHIR